MYVWIVLLINEINDLIVLEVQYISVWGVVLPLDIERYKLEYSYTRPVVHVGERWLFYH